MGQTNPNDSVEILYGSSGDVRNEINAFVAAGSAGHYADETEIPGALIIQSMVHATREINSYLEVVYADQIPFTTTASVPKYLDMVGDDIATYYTFRSSSAKVVAMNTAMEEKRSEYYERYTKEPDGILCKLRDRKMQLSELQNLYADEIKTVVDPSRAHIFDVDDEKRWRVDPKLIDDVERERGL